MRLLVEWMAVGGVQSGSLTRAVRHACWSAMATSCHDPFGVNRVRRDPFHANRVDLRCRRIALYRRLSQIVLNYRKRTETLCLPGESADLLVSTLGAEP